MGKVTIELKDPIRGPSFPSTCLLLTVGILLLIYPLAWLFFLQYYEPANNNSMTTTGMGIQSRLLAGVAYWILDLIPWMANAGLSIFLAAFFFYAGSVQRQHTKAQ